jgi:hypothetical protein
LADQLPLLLTRCKSRAPESYSPTESAKRFKRGRDEAGRGNARVREHRKSFEGTTEIWAQHWNDDPKPFICHKAADDIIDKVRRGTLKLHQINPATDH